MTIFMLGWEFPPYLTGGLGTACYGLTKALAARNAKIIFVMPRPITPQPGDFVRVLAPSYESFAGYESKAREDANIAASAKRPPRPGSPHIPPFIPALHEVVDEASEVDSQRDSARDPLAGLPVEDPAFANVEFKVIDLPGLVSPYQAIRPPEVARPVPALDSEPFSAHCRAGFGQIDPQSEASLSGPETLESSRLRLSGFAPPPAPTLSSTPTAQPTTRAGDYPTDLVARCRLYARLAVDLARPLKFDVIHAHDWMSFPAGLAVSATTGKPLVVHVHSTEYDRASLHVNPFILDIERRGMMGAMRVIAVSLLTKSILQRRYGIGAEKISVIHNGIDPLPLPINTNLPTHVPQRLPHHKRPVAIRQNERVVLFLGRLTTQKGPDHFLAAAKKVLEKTADVKFVIAGTGDMTPEVVQAVASAGLGSKVLFTGFLRVPDVERVFAMADVYVMPSVSEPFGIAALEAIRHDVPVVLSKTSGVSEVIRHALKADFWNAEDLADKIIAVLRHPPLGSTLRQHADIELRELTWDQTAKKCMHVYRDMKNLDAGEV
jgi:glycogen(starch) synthase